MPPTEREDVLASYNILDTAPEAEFDDLVAIAQHACGTKTALVSLVDADRQWFKARIGFPVSETSLDKSVCAHALLVDEILVIPDLAADPRTAANPFVTAEPRIRFYAGAVLRSPQGVAIGSLCVIDDEPRPGGLTPGQAETLKALARLVMTLLSFRRALTTRDEVSARLAADGDRQALAQEVGGIGTFAVEVATGAMTVSAEFRRMLGFPSTSPLTLAEFQALSFSLSEARHSTPAMRRNGLAPREVEYRIRRAGDGALRWIIRRVGFRTGPDGAVEQMIGTIQDVTDRKRADMRMQALVELGDALRDVTAVAEVVAVAVRIAGETLAAARTGYAQVDAAMSHLTIGEDWRAPGQHSLAGAHPIDAVRMVADRLSLGSPVVVANVAAASWLGAERQGPLLRDVKAMLAVPLLRQGHLTGLLFVQDGEPRTWTRDETDFAVSVADRTYAAIARIEAEKQQRVLQAELSHRLKNTLSMVQAMVNQTLRGLPERGLVRALEERIIALSKAHDLLVQQSWSAAPITAIVAKVVELHGAERFAVAGPHLLCGAKATLSLSLLLHELATNAVKYGALSVPDGSIDLVWRIDGAGGEAVLVLTWTETGGPPAVAPHHRGFGSRLIAMGLAGAARAKIDYRAEGLAATFEAPLGIVTEP